MLKNIWFRIHWLIGITAGIVLAIVGTTGALISFEEQILRALNLEVRKVEPRKGGPLSPVQLLRQIKTNHPDRRINGLMVSSDSTESARVTFAQAGNGREGGSRRDTGLNMGSPQRFQSGAAGSPEKRQGDGGGRGPRGETRYVDPYTGEVFKGDGSRGQTFFRSVRSIHRWLTVGELGNRSVGKQIVGTSTILLLVLGLSGLYLRWPRRALDWRAWLKLNMKLKGRAFLWNLHSVAGTCVLLFYLVFALTGLYWSYDWYRNGLFAITGVERPKPSVTENTDGQTREARADDERSNGARMDRNEPIRSTAELGRAWETFLRETTTVGFKTANITLPQGPGRQIEIRYIDADPPHTRASNTLAVDAASGAVLSHERYADKSVGGKLMASMFPLHSGIFFGLPGIILYMLASLTMPLFAVTGWMLYLDRRSKKKRVVLAMQRATSA